MIHFVDNVQFTYHFDKNIKKGSSKRPDPRNRDHLTIWLQLHWEDVRYINSSLFVIQSLGHFKYARHIRYSTVTSTVCQKGSQFAIHVCYNTDLSAILFASNMVVFFQLHDAPMNTFFRGHPNIWIVSFMFHCMQHFVTQHFHAWQRPGLMACSMMAICKSLHWIVFLHSHSNSIVNV